MIEILFVLAVVVLTFLNASWGLLLLAGGFVLADQRLAHWHISAPGLPLYATELALLVFVLRWGLPFLYRHTNRGSIKDAAPWLVVGLFGLQSVVRGFAATYPAVEVIRDSALFYYCLFALWAGSVASLEFLKRAAIVLGSLLAFRSLFILASFFTATPLGGQPAAMSMYLAIGVLALAAREIVVKSQWQAQILPSFWVALIFLLRVRTAWLALALSSAVACIGAWRRGEWRPAAASLGKVALAGLVMSYGISLLPGVSVTWKDLTSEIHSLGSGKDSPNVLTRFYFWRDAVEQVLGTGLARERPATFKMLTGPDNGMGESGVARNYARNAKELEGLPLVAPEVPLKLQAPGVAVIELPELREPGWVRGLLGIPFGYPFMPPRVSWLITKRFDPHNSFVAWFYRMGFLGLMAIFWLLFSELHLAWRRLRGPDLSAMHRALLVASFLAVLYCLIHAQTDVTLENAYKGAFFWISLGVMRFLRLRPVETP
jgi:hypothetical protein